MACGATILKLDRDQKLLNANVTWTQQFDLKSVEPVQKHVNKCEQRIILETYNHVSLSQEPDKRKMIQNSLEIYAQEKL